MNDPAPLNVRRLWVSGIVAAIAAAGVTSGIRLGVVAGLEADPGFEPLVRPEPAVLFTVVAVLAATGLRHLLGRRAARPRVTFARTAVVLTALSLVPNIIFALAPEASPVPGMTPSYALGLGVLHVAAALVAIPILARAFPPRRAAATEEADADAGAAGEQHPSPDGS